MKAIAANQVPSVDSGLEETPHWSPTDDLLVWTVSRLEGGRRSGVEADCHVVYALTATHFVEQTRRYRASAQQCIQMLLDNKKLGRMQRKIELSTIMALHSDARTGRLAIRTLNGTHYLEPVSNEEADVLREIAMEIEVRMPAGGAQFHGAPIDFGDKPRVYSAEEDRRAAVAVDHARAEDEPDTMDPAHYVLSSPPPQIPAEVQEYVVATNAPADHAAELAEAPGSSDLPVQSAADQSQQLPQNITVTGGVAIRYAPSPEHAIDPHAPTLSGYVPAAGTIAGLQEAPYPAPVSATEVELERRVVDDPAFPAAFDRRQHRTFRSQLEGAAAANPTPPKLATAAPVQESPYAAPGPVQESPFAAPAPTPMQSPDQQSPFAAPGPVQESPFAGPAPAPMQSPDQQSPFAAPAPVQESPFAAPGPVQESPYAAPASVQHAPYANPQVAEPAPPAVETTPQTAVAAPNDVPVTASEMYNTQPNVRPPDVSPLSPRSEGSRDNDAQAFPSVFDRRSLRAASEETPGWLAPGGSTSAEFDAEPDAEADEAEETTEASLPEGPPTIGPPVVSSGGPQTVSTGGAVGFNPDFDVNQFR